MDPVNLTLWKIYFRIDLKNVLKLWRVSKRPGYSAIIFSFPNDVSQRNALFLDWLSRSFWVNLLFVLISTIEHPLSWKTSSKPFIAFDICICISQRCFAMSYVVTLLGLRMAKVRYNAYEFSAIWRFKCVEIRIFVGVFFVCTGIFVSRRRRD